MTVVAPQATAAPVAPLAGAIEPAWWTGTSAVDEAAVTVDAGGRLGPADLAADSTFAADLRGTFAERGLVWARNTGLTGLEAQRRVAALVLDGEMAYEAGANPRGRLQPSVYEVGAPLSAWLHYHHEMAYVGTSPTMVAFLAHRTLPGRGATWVSDNLVATEAILATTLGQRLREHGITYHRDLTDRDAPANQSGEGVYNHWQQSLGTDDPDEAERRARAQGLETSWGPDRLLRTRYTVSAFEYCPQLDRNVLFSSIADDGHWFDTWPQVMHLPVDQRPLRLTLGDGTPLAEADRRLWVDVYDRGGAPLDWRDGDVGVVCNWRFAHGRPGIHLAPGEVRELGVMLGAPFTREGDRADKW